MGNQFKLKGVFPLLFSVTRVQNPALKNFLTKETILLLGSGPDKISNLSSFQPPFTHYPVINLTQYPLQLDLLLYCSVIISINFKGHGFMHQENHICTTSGEWHFFSRITPIPHILRQRNTWNVCSQQTVTLSRCRYGSMTTYRSYQGFTNAFWISKFGESYLPVVPTSFGYLDFI